VSAPERRPVIHDRAFYWRYADGRLEPITVPTSVLRRVQQLNSPTGPGGWSADHISEAKR